MSKKNPDGLLPLFAVPVRDVLDKIAELLEKILEKLNQIAQRLGVPAVPAPPTTVEIAKVNRYDVAEIDLTDAHTDEPVGLKPLGIVASSITWEEVQADVTYKLNSKGNKSLAASKGVQHDNWEIEEIYITNTAAAGKKAVLYYEWRE